MVERYCDLYDSYEFTVINHLFQIILFNHNLNLNHLLCMGICISGSAGLGCHWKWLQQHLEETWATPHDGNGSSEAEAHGGDGRAGGHWWTRGQWQSKSTPPCKHGDIRVSHIHISNWLVNVLYPRQRLAHWGGYWGKRVADFKEARERQDYIYLLITATHQSCSPISLNSYSVCEVILEVSFPLTNGTNISGTTTALYYLCEWWKQYLIIPWHQTPLLVNCLLTAPASYTSDLPGDICFNKGTHTRTSKSLWYLKIQ